MTKDVNVTSNGAGTLSAERSRSLLQVAINGDLDAAVLDGVTLQREAAAAFVADVASLIGAVAESAGLERCKLISELLYTEAFRDAVDGSVAPVAAREISAGQARLNR